MRDIVNHEIRLKGRPHGLPSADNFDLVETPIPRPGPGEVLVRNIFMSIDPYMRLRMDEGSGEGFAFRLGETLSGGAVGEIVEANGNDRFKPGDTVLSYSGWREWFVTQGLDLEKIDPTKAPIQAYVGAFGMPGLTAYAGILKVAEIKDGDRVFVSAAAGAVGAIVCQIAKIKGCWVMGSAGSDAKCDWLVREAGIDKAINYKNAPDLAAALRAAAPDGFDVYFDNVGGEHLEAALANMRDHGRVVICGMVSQYNATEPPPGLRSLFPILGKRLTIKGVAAPDYAALKPEFLGDMSAWAKAGKLKWKETIVDGLSNAPQALIGLFSGENFGKMLVRLGPDRLE